MTSFSIIICFYNAGGKLIPTLEHIKHLDISNITTCELILVNNNSNDDSCVIIQEEMKEFSVFPWKIVDEPNPGLSNARLKGIAESQFEYMLFCDDDNWLASDYIQNAISILEPNKTIAVLGGYCEAVSDIELPKWFAKIKNYYAVGEQFPTNGKVHGVRNVVYGAGMIVRRTAWEYIVSNGFTFFTLGRTGRKLSSGEDSELCLAFQIAEFDIWYDNSLQFKHFIESKRLTNSYLKQLQNGMSSSGYVTRFYRNYLFGYKPHVTKYFWLKEFLYSLKDLVQGIFVKPTIVGMKRNLDFTLYLVRERSRYNENVKKVLGICENLEESRRTSLLK